MKPRCKKAVNLPFISVGMSPFEILTHQIDSCLEQSECGPKGLRSRLGRERRHEVTLRFSCGFGKRTACRCSDGFRTPADQRAIAWCDADSNRTRRVAPALSPRRYSSTACSERLRREPAVDGRVRAVEYSRGRQPSLS